MRFTSERYPFLHVHDLGVRFADGVADVSGSKRIAALKRLEDLGVRPASGRDDAPADDAASPPAQSAAKAVWVAWAVKALGVETAEAESMTKADLMDLAAPSGGQADGSGGE